MCIWKKAHRFHQILEGTYNPQTTNDSQYLVQFCPLGVINFAVMYV